MDFQESQMQGIKNGEELYFETVFIVDGDFEVIHPNSPSPPPRGMGISEHPVVNNSFSIVREELVNSNEEFIVPHISDSENFIIPEFGGNESTENIDGLDIKQGYDCAKKKPLWPQRTQSNSNDMGDTRKEYTNCLSLTSSYDKETLEEIDSSFSNKPENPLLKRKMKLKRLQQKVQHLNEKLSKINEVIDISRNVVPNNVPKSSFNSSKFMSGTFNDLSTPISEESSQISTKGTEFNMREQIKNKTSNQPYNVSSKELNIDFLKRKIIEASQTLIKTEKSLQVLRKFLRSEVLVKRQTATKHLKDFKYTVNTFRKAIKQIDNSVLTHYGHFLPNILPDQVCDNDLSKHKLDSEKAEENINDFQNLPTKKRLMKTKLPVKTRKKRSTGSTDRENNRFSKLESDHSNLVVESEQTKISKSNNSPSKKKIKTRIIQGNWRTKLGQKYVDNDKLSSKKCSQSNTHIAYQ